jgi:hypothetical protein
MLDFLPRRPGYDAEIYTEAQSLLDDGLDLDFVLGLYPADEEWLAPLLETSDIIGEAFAAEEPSYYFEASLKAKFLAAAHEGARPAAIGPSPLAPLRTALAAIPVAGAAAALGVITLGFVTAGSAVPGDWNYSFKLAHERVQYTLSRGDERINVQLNQTEARVRELQQTSSKGSVSSNDLERFQRQWSELAQTISGQDIGSETKDRVRDLVQTSTTTLNEVRTTNPSLAAAAGTAENTVKGVGVAAGIGGTPGALQTPTPSATPTPTASSTPVATSATTEPAISNTPPASPSPSPSPSESATPAESPSPSPSPTP